MGRRVADDAHVCRQGTSAEPPQQRAILSERTPTDRGGLRHHQRKTVRGIRGRPLSLPRSRPAPPPDRGGDVETMQRINIARDRIEQSFGR